MYIGVTGFTSRDQVRHALSCVPTDPNRSAMVGVLASHKTMQGLPASNPMRYPRREEIAGIFQMDWRVINLVHYTTRDQAHLYDQLMQVLEWGGPACNGLQLNMVWPAPETLARLRRAQPKDVIVLQINRGAMNACANSAERVAQRVSAEYGSLVNYVLVDASGGDGIPLSPIDASAYLVELEMAKVAHRHTYELVVAGGLCAENLTRLLVPIRLLVHRFGFDAEGALRTDDRLDERKVAAYLQAAYKMPL